MGTILAIYLAYSPLFIIVLGPGSRFVRLRAFWFGETQETGATWVTWENIAIEPVESLDPSNFR